MFGFLTFAWHASKDVRPNAMSAYSPVNVSDPDLDRFPKFETARATECRVEEGDVIYVPTRWWHYVESHPDEEGKAIGINFFYRPWYHKMGFDEGHASRMLIRNEHYTHLWTPGDDRTAFSCPDDESRVCFTET